MHAYLKERKRLPVLLVIDSILLVLGVASLAVYYILRAHPGFADAVCSAFAGPVGDMLSRVSDKVTFSVAEVVYAVGILFVIFHIVYAIIRIKRSYFKLWQFLHRLFILLIVIVFFWNLYGWLWGIEYYSESFSDQTGIPTVAPANVNDLFKVTVLFLVASNALSTEVARDADGHFAEDLDEILDSAPTLYDNIAEYFPCLEGECCRPKAMVFSEIMSIMGFTGLYFPYTGESNINVDVPASFIPATVAHELAHQLGYASEQECNFIGILACMASGDVVYQYSGYMRGLLYLMNALYASDYEAWKYLRENFTEELEQDWADNSEYWKRYESPVEGFFEKVYDLYLRGNGQIMGIYSYEACVTMLVEYFK